MTDIKLKLAKVGSQFTVKANLGTAGTNLYQSLHHATLDSSSYLHPIKGYIDSITNVFDNPLVKKEIRSGGLSSSMQKLVWKKLCEQHPEIADNVVVKERMKRIIKHYGKEEQTAMAENEHPAYGAGSLDNSSTPVARISANPISEIGHQEDTLRQTASTTGFSTPNTNVSSSIADLQRRKLGGTSSVASSKSFKPIIPLLK